MSYDSDKHLAKDNKILNENGVDGIILMDSAGALSTEVYSKVKILKK